MANSIALAKKYMPLLDEVYAKSSVTAFMDAQTQLDFTSTNEVKIAKISMDGLANYSRSTGYVAGDVTMAWETKTLAQERGRKFSIDRMDDEETLMLTFGKLASEFIRTKVVPEIDAYRFATIAGTSGINKAFGALTASGAVKSAWSTAVATLRDKEVSGQLVFFATPACIENLKDSMSRQWSNETNLVRQVGSLDSIPVIEVPSTRFASEITLVADGDGGYTLGTNKLNFVMLDTAAVQPVVKLALPKIFRADEDQNGDMDKFLYRLYHDMFVMDNKVSGIYVHSVSEISGS